MAKPDVAVLLGQLRDFRWHLTGGQLPSRQLPRRATVGGEPGAIKAEPLSPAGFISFLG